MRFLCPIVLGLFVSLSSYSQEFDFFESNPDCAARLDELLFLAQASRRGIAVEEQLYDGGTTSTLSRIFVREDRGVREAAKRFASLIGMPLATAHTGESLDKNLANAIEVGHGILLQTGRQVIFVRFAHVQGKRVAILKSNLVAEINPLALDDFMNEFLELSPH